MGDQRINMKHLFVLLLLSAGFCFFGQPTGLINSYDKQGRKHGFWQKEKDGKIVYRGKFIHGVPVDTFFYYYPNGRVKSILVYSDSGKKARAAFYSPSGILISEGMYVRMNKEGLWKYYTEEKKLASEIEYKNGKKNGRAVYYFPDGKIANIEHYVNDTLEGEYIRYYDNGNVHYKGNFSKNKREGEFTFYYYDGVLSATGAYKNDLREGWWKLYDRDGKIILEAYYHQSDLQKKIVYQKDKDPEVLQKIDSELDLKARQEHEAKKNQKMEDEE